MSSAVPKAAYHTNPCGSCKVCCKIMGIPELEKRPGVWCPFVNPDHAALSGGCTRYSTRPKACKDFLCAWASGQAQNLLDQGADDRPDRMGAMVWSFQNQFSEPVVGVAETKPDALNRPRVKRLVDDLVNAGFEVRYRTYDEQEFTIEGSGKWKEYILPSAVDRPGADIIDGTGVVITGRNGSSMGPNDADDEGYD